MEARRLTKMALLTALLCISAYISFPLPFSPAMVTALTLVATLTGLLLQPKDAFIVFIIYVLLGAVGLPVFVGGTAGLGKLLGPTGGFIFSWPIAYTLLSVFKGSKKELFLLCMAFYCNYNSCSIPIWCGRLYDSYKNRTLGSVASSNVPIHSRGHCKMSCCFLVSN